MHLDTSSSALRSFTHGFGSLVRFSSVPSFLVPAATRNVLLFSRRSKQQFCCGRKQFSNTVDSPRQREYNAVDVDSTVPTPGLSSLTNSPELRRDQEAWVALLDPYLPLELRSKGWLENLSKFQGVRTIQSLPALLSEARTAPPLWLDLLNYAGVSQQRWHAVLWLVQALLEHSDAEGKPIEWSPMSRRFWSSSGSLDELTSDSFGTDQTLSPVEATSFSLDDITRNALVLSTDIRQRVLAQIWLSTGNMILEAADRTPDESSEIMSYVHQILAQLHHHNVIPNSVYNYKPAQDPSVLQRPPTLYLLSSRILTTLSDAAWRAQEKEILSEAVSVGARYVYKGHELPGARYKPRVREMGVEVWLELVLWSCVEGGWITEAASIVEAMTKRKEPHRRWFVINWDAIQQASKIDWERVRAISAGVSGGIEGYSADPPFVEMGPRTISSEVITALVDGLVSTTRSSTHTDEGSNTAAKALHYIKICKGLLERERERFGLESSSWNSVMLRMIESSSFDPETTPTILERILDFAPTYQKELEVLNSPAAPGSAAQDYVAEQSAAGLGLLHRVLLLYARRDDIHGAMRIFHKLQSFVDTNREKSIQEFAAKVNVSVRTGEESLEKKVPTVRSDIPGINPETPTSVMAALLDLATDTKEYDLGKWLLYADDVDGPTIGPHMYGRTNLQPSLLRFATATADADLLLKIVRKLSSPMSGDTLREVLRCQVALEKWDAVEDILAHLHSQRNTNLGATDIMILAKTILKIEQKHKVDSEENEESLLRAQVMLNDILEGTYDRPQDPSQPPTFERSRLLAQLSAILSTVPGVVSKIALDHLQLESRKAVHVSVYTNAFNKLLDGVVEIHGALAGKDLWDTWCQEPRSEQTDQITENANKQVEIQKIAEDEVKQGKVVAPTLQTLRIILRPTVRALQENPAKGSQPNKNTSPSSTKTSKAPMLTIEDDKPVEPDNSADDRQAETREAPEVATITDTDRELLDWGVARYREFGLDNKAVKLEIPGYFEKRERPTRRGEQPA